uniref:Uncharacterized protein n=1 Tax=Dulem virus 63 TaxID=3145774 RepID=A0AAU8B2L8_9VIRU
MQNLRLTKEESEILYRTTININRELVRLGKMPLKDSELLHKIIEQTLKLGEIEVTRDGQIRVLANELNEVK